MWDVNKSTILGSMVLLSSVVIFAVGLHILYILLWSLRLYCSSLNFGFVRLWFAARVIIMILVQYTRRVASSCTVSCSLLFVALHVRVREGDAGFVDARAVCFVVTRGIGCYVKDSRLNGKICFAF